MGVKNRRKTGIAQI